MDCQCVQARLIRMASTTAATLRYAWTTIDVWQHAIDGWRVPCGAKGVSQFRETIVSAKWYYREVYGRRLRTTLFRTELYFAPRLYGSTTYTLIVTSDTQVWQSTNTMNIFFCSSWNAHPKLCAQQHKGIYATAYCVLHVVSSRNEPKPNAHVCMPFICVGLSIHWCCHWVLVYILPYVSGSSSVFFSAIYEIGYVLPV